MSANLLKHSAYSYVTSKYILRSPPLRLHLLATDEGQASRNTPPDMPANTRHDRDALPENPARKIDPPPEFAPRTEDSPPLQTPSVRGSDFPGLPMPSPPEPEIKSTEDVYDGMPEVSPPPDITPPPVGPDVSTLDPVV